MRVHLSINITKCSWIQKFSLQVVAYMQGFSNVMLKVNLHKVTEQRLGVYCDVSRRPDVHGFEEALLSAHLAAGLDCPWLEDVLRCTAASRSSQKWSYHREPLQRWIQLAENDGYGYCIWKGMRITLHPLIYRLLGNLLGKMSCAENIYASHLCIYSVNAHTGWKWKQLFLTMT